MTFLNHETVRILIIEDDAHWVEIIRANLPGNFHFDIASTIDEVKTLLQNNQYHLIIADLVLSEVNPILGIFRDFDNLIFAIKQMKSRGRLWPPIIVITAYSINSEMPEVLNRYGGWIWGWHEKEGLDMGEFHRHVETAIATKAAFEGTIKPSDKWTLRDLAAALVSMTTATWGAVAGIAGLLLTLAYFVGVLTAS